MTEKKVKSNPKTHKVLDAMLDALGGDSWRVKGITGDVVAVTEATAILLGAMVGGVVEVAGAPPEKLEEGFRLVRGLMLSKFDEVTTRIVKDAQEAHSAGKEPQ